jgi:hypothetical protein
MSGMPLGRGGVSLKVPYMPQGRDAYGCIKAAVMMVLCAKGVKGVIPISPGQLGLKDSDVRAYAAMYGFGAFENLDGILKRDDTFRHFVVNVLPQYGPLIVGIKLPRGGLGHPLADYATVENDGSYGVGSRWTHALVITGYDGDGVTYLDPARDPTPLRMTWNDAIEQITSLWVHDITEHDLQRWQ